MVGNSSQQAYPWRAVARTVFAFVLAVAVVWPSVVEAAGVESPGPVVAATLTVAAAITRVMALPGVIELFARFLPWLAPSPPTSGVLDAPDPGAEF